MSANTLSATRHTTVGTEVTGSLWETVSCPDIEGTVGGASGVAYGTFFGGPLQGYPTGQPLVFGDLSGGTININPYLHQGIPKLFELPAPVHTVTVQARAPCIVPMAAAHARSTLVVRVDKNGLDTVL